MASKMEDAIKSFEGWQEALYIREDETEAGKTAKKVRDEEKLINLTRDSKASAVSKPVSINGPKTIEADKMAVYTIEKYNDTATKEDKNNIRWSIWVTDDKKTNYTIINAKSKVGLYSYVKMDLDGDKNKLTIIFDKALKDKKVQIEPFRDDTPKIDQSTKGYDFIKTTTIKEPGTPKIIIRDQAHLYIKTQCNSIENAGTKIDNEFLKGSAFKLEAKPFWTDPIKDSEITLYNFSAVYKPKGSCFGNVRLQSKNGKLVAKPHTGLDIFAEKGTNLFASLDGVVERIYGKSDDNSYGNVIVIEADSVEYLIKSKNKYILKYAKEIEKGPDFNLNEKIYLRYAHVQKALVKVGDKVKSGDKIGLLGVTGNASGTKAPHLHFEIANLPRPGRGLVNRCNPAFYVNHKGETKANKSHQEKISKTSHKI